MLKPQPPQQLSKPHGLRWGAESILTTQPPPQQQHQERPGAAAIGSARGQSTGKGPPQSPVFEGVYNNSRMLHFLTAVVGSTCDVKVKNGTTYEGIFKTLSSNFELAEDIVHQKASEPAGGPRREDTVDTMVFKPSDVMLVHFQNADFNYATKDNFTDSAIKVLQRWERGDSNSDNYDLESNMSNGWDPNEMFKFNEENYGVKTTYDSSLSPFTVPLEKDNSKLRAAQLAPEIESSPQYHLRIAVESDDGRTEEEKHRAVQRQGSGRESPSLASRKGKYIIPLPQRVQEGPQGGPGLSNLSPRGPHHLDNSNPGPGSEARGINGGPSHMSPKAQRPLRGAKTLSLPNNRPSGETSVPPPAVGRMYPPSSPRSAAPAPISPSCPELPIGLAVPTFSASVPVTSSVSDPGMGYISSASPKISLAPTDLAQIAEKVPGLQNEQKLFQLEELRKCGAQFKLQPGSSPENSLDPFLPWTLKEEAKGKEKEDDGLLTSEPMGSPVSSKTESVSDKEDKPPLAPAGGTEGPEPLHHLAQAKPAASPLASSKERTRMRALLLNKKSTLNPNTKEFNPTKPLLSVNKSTSIPTSPGPQTDSTPSIPVLTAGRSGLYSPQYISYTPQIQMGPAVQAPQMYPYPVSNSVSGQQGKYWGAKGSLLPQLWEQHQPASAPPRWLLQLPGPPAMMQPMAHYPSQPVFAPMLQSNPRMLMLGSHPQVIVSSSTPQYPSVEQPTPQALYVTAHQAYPYYATQLHAHQPQPAITPTGNQPAAPSPVQHQAGVAPHLDSGQPQQNLYHPGALTSMLPSLPPGPSAQSPQSGFPQPATVYAIHHKQLPHGFTNMAHVPQAHVQTGNTAAPPPHPGAPHSPQVMLLHPPQSHGPPPDKVQCPRVGCLHSQLPHPYPTPTLDTPKLSVTPTQLPFHPAGELKIFLAAI
uniref:Sm domain-containing protein n=1 Tax=Pan paniscus TaxID=9597 RepID=A0A2R9BHX4_PANPA